MNDRSPLRSGRDLPALTGLRFVAAFGVLICHFVHHLLPTGPEILVRFGVGLFNMVGLFFILSGFILAHTYGERLTSGATGARSFLLARFARLYPTYLLGLTLGFPGLYIWVLATDRLRIFEFGAIVLPMLQSWLAWTPLYSDAWNGPSWSISTELFFYLAFPIVIRPLMRLHQGRLWITLAACFLLSVVPALAFDIWGKEGAAFFIRWPLFRLPEFISGIVTYRLLRNALERGVTLPPNLRTFGLGLILIGTIAICVSPLQVAKSQGLTIPLFISLIAILACGEGSFARLLSTSAFVRLGNESYALYLIHIPLSSLLFIVFKRLGYPVETSGAIGVIFAVMSIAISILLASFAHRWIEIPGRRWILGRRPVSPDPVRS